MANHSGEAKRRGNFLKTPCKGAGGSVPGLQVRIERSGQTARSDSLTTAREAFIEQKHLGTREHFLKHCEDPLVFKEWQAFQNSSG